MAALRVFQIKWYHLLIGGLVLLGVLLVWLWVFLSRSGPSYFAEDKTDIVR
jgi:hypothetical protein